MTQPVLERSAASLGTFDLEVRGARLRYLDGGGAPVGTRGAVLLLHGLGRDHRQWGDLAGELARSRRVIVPDLPGFGASAFEPARARASFEQIAEVVLDLIAALSLGRVAIIGHGIGGAVGIVVAADRPEFVERLALVAPVCHRRAQRWDERALRLPLLGPLLGRAVLGARLAERHGLEGRPSPAFWSLLDACADPATIEARLPRVRAPALVVWGREDPVASAANGPRLARELGNARLEILDCGRFPEEERPSPFVALVRGFLDDLPSAPLASPHGATSGPVSRPNGRRLPSQGR
jgi:pimeloyl-ACP methyl ester carboxylesterase